MCKNAKVTAEWLCAFFFSFFLIIFRSKYNNFIFLELMQKKFTTLLCKKLWNLDMKALCIAVCRQFDCIFIVHLCDFNNTTNVSFFSLFGTIQWFLYEHINIIYCKYVYRKKFDDFALINITHVTKRYCLFIFW